MKIMKFGGSSLADKACFERVAELVKASVKSGQVVLVLSAPKGITDQLTQLVMIAEQRKGYQSVLSSLEVRVDELLGALNLSQTSHQNTRDQVEQYFVRLRRWLQGIESLGCAPDLVKAKVLSLGEYLSVALMHAYLHSAGSKVANLATTDYLLAKGPRLESEVDLDQSTARFSQLDPSIDIYVMPGFVAGDEQGELCLLGRNGSDYSAAALAAVLRADSCEIWTDVAGVYQTDPRVVKDAKVVTQLSYQEAMEMSFFGAKVLHPKTILPIAKFETPCWIKNTFDPDAPGTLIKKTASDEPIKSVNFLDSVAVITVSGVGMKGKVGMADRVFKTVSNTNCSIILITQSSSEYSISFVVMDEDAELVSRSLKEEFALECQHNFIQPIDVRRQLAVVSLVGDGMRNKKGTAAKFFTALAQANINVVAIAQGSSETSISAVIDANNQALALRSCYQALFDTRRFIDVFLIGCGVVGGELLTQLQNQNEFLDKQGIKIRLRCVTNSKSMLMAKEEIDLSQWQSQLAEQGQKFDIQSLVTWMEQSHIVNPVLVDCTSSEAIASQYAYFLEHGFHVVTPNKKANTISMAYYDQLRQIAKQKHRKFLYETTVGAGLPVIDNLKSLISAGDQLVSFEGILSGSLSYILGELEQGTAFSEVVIGAKNKGFTEPDPRDDLSGMDVARKLLIIARETGMTLELADVAVESLIPDSASTDIRNPEIDTNTFLGHLPSLDDYYANKVAQARDTGKVLRYIGTLDQQGARVSVQAVDSSHPLFDVKGGNNALALLTHYYQPDPLVIRGYGAGAKVTAAGVFSDILKTLHWELEG
jgi:bifunctional aspartokinase / homoserine dehydrogenase 1